MPVYVTHLRHKTRRNNRHNNGRATRQKVGGARTQPSRQSAKVPKRPGIVGQPLTKTGFASFFTKANANAVVENQKRKNLLATNVTGLLADKNSNSNMFEDPEWADKIFEKFTDFLEKLDDLEEGAGEEKDHNILSDISILKIDIATKLISVFGTKASTIVESGEKINAFNDDLAALLGRVTL